MSIAATSRSCSTASPRGRREITLVSSLPPRLSLRSYMGHRCRASEFGAPERGQWPPWSVRRFLLYHALLHELAHLQLVDAAPGAWDGEFAGETLADEFANEWRGRLYSASSGHRDPVHDAPSDDELAMLPLWNDLDKPRRLELTTRVLGAAPGDGSAWLANATIEQVRFLRRVLHTRRMARATLTS